MVRRAISGYVVEELCQEDGCALPHNGPWHALDLDDLIRDGAANDHGGGVECTITVRVRKVEVHKVLARKSKPLRPREG